jgi:eukaryotic-like serine/threonine-protein kinase
VEDSTERAPPRIGRFEIEEEIGRGTMGVVYRARDPLLGRPVALKVVRLLFVSSDDDRRALEQRFLNEARIVARLSHPGIVVVHDVGRDDASGEPFIALEYLVGRTLASLLVSRACLPWQESVRVVARVAEALDYAHRRGVIHRDIKPANIMLLASGDPKLMDFGIAKVLVGRDVTSTARLLGTPLYMSPEQALGAPIDGRADIFALGAVAYALLTGRAAFDAPTVAGIIERVVAADPPRPAALRPELPAALDYVLARALAKAKQDRYPDASDLADDLEDILARREPRHRAGWEAPAVTERTVLSRSAPVPGAEDLPELVLDPLEEHTPFAAPTAPPSPALAALAPTTRLAVPTLTRRSRSLTSLGLAALSLGLVAFAFVYWGEGPATWLRPAETPSTTPRDPLSEPQPSERAAPDARETAPTPSPQPSAPTPAEERGLRARSNAELVFALEHPLQRGTVTVWVDQRRLIERPLVGGLIRDWLVVKTWKGSLADSVPVAPGRHTFRVQVRWNDGAESAELVGVFRAGQARRLEARLGRVSGKLSLAWR